MELRRRQLLQLAAAGLGGAGWLLAGRRAPAAPLPAAPHLRIGLISDLNSSYGSTSYIPEVAQGLRQLLARRRP